MLELVLFFCPYHGAILVSFKKQEDRASYLFSFLFFFISNVFVSILFRVNFLLVRLILAPVQRLQHCHPVRSPGLVSVAIQEPDHWCPVSAAGQKSSLPPWIFHLWILQNQCSVFAFQDRDHGSAFSFTTPYLFVFLSVCTYVCVIFLNLSPHCLPLENHNVFMPLLHPHSSSSPFFPCLHFSAMPLQLVQENSHSIYFFNLIWEPTGN